ncbi:hypothetical protein F5148DRAFT_1186713 [Russula earlei]|uniref:Uncharacterized protein n=1 Tax=Russula earlei TaxID=71964 RepID=A0ACC0UDG9_9AGAM|nr:hypothetical protein F5148DRAFT_1186713 [Russula earlei]
MAPLLEGSVTTASWRGSVVLFWGILVSALLALSTNTSTGEAFTAVWDDMAWSFNTGLGQADFGFFVRLVQYLRGGNIIGAKNASSGWDDILVDSCGSSRPCCSMLSDC